MPERLSWPTLSDTKSQPLISSTTGEFGTRMPAEAKRSICAVPASRRKIAECFQSQAKQFPAPSKAMPSRNPCVPPMRSTEAPSAASRSKSPVSVPPQMDPSRWTATPSGCATRGLVKMPSKKTFAADISSNGFAIGAPFTRAAARQPVAIRRAEAGSAWPAAWLRAALSQRGCLDPVAGHERSFGREFQRRRNAGLRERIVGQCGRQAEAEGRADRFDADGEMAPIPRRGLAAPMGVPEQKAWEMLLLPRESDPVAVRMVGKRHRAVESMDLQQFLRHGGQWQA